MGGKGRLGKEEKIEMEWERKNIKRNVMKGKVFIRIIKKDKNVKKKRIGKWFKYIVKRYRMKIRNWSKIESVKG